MKKLTALQLSPFVGNQCYFNNGRNVLKGEMTLMLLHNYNNGSCVGIIPLLRPISTMTAEELNAWTGDLFVPEFAAQIVQNISLTMFGLHQFISKYGTRESLQWLFENGFDVYNWIDEKLALNANLSGLGESFPAKDFATLLETL